MNLTKSELSLFIAKEAEVPQATAQKVLEAFMKVVPQELTKGNSIELRGFGKFINKVRKAKIGRNITAGTSVNIPERIKKTFHFSKEHR